MTPLFSSVKEGAGPEFASHQAVASAIVWGVAELMLSQVFSGVAGVQHEV